MRKVKYRTWKDVGGGQFGDPTEIKYSRMCFKGYFHEFTELEGNKCAFIEGIDGKVLIVELKDFKFVDSPETIDREQRRYEIAREQMAHGVIPRMAVNDADCLIEVSKGKSK